MTSGTSGKHLAKKKNTITPQNLSGEKCEEHFKALFAKVDANIDQVLQKVNCPINEFLNREITLSELKSVIKRLAYKKAVGPDSIANEFLKTAPPNLLRIILKFLNLNLRQGLTCKKWCQDLIALIHKDGDKSDPNNYRGICVMNALLKVLCTLLNDRLTEYCKDKQLINNAQIGFVQLCRTSDHIFTLKSVVNKYVTYQKGKKLYTCFVDFQKAFDSVWHEALFRKLENLGINGNFLQIIKNIYNNTECAVKINGRGTKYFKYKKGVQQGNPLSPLLFNLFINDIFKAVKNDARVTLDGQNYFNALMYADDLIIIATSPEELQRSLDGLSEYCEKWKLNVNVKKTKCMTFSKRSNIKQHHFHINNTNIQNVREYKYLGITINASNCSFAPTLTNLSQKANRAIFAITSKLPFKKAPIKTILKLFNSCIEPILTYGSEIWAP